MKTIVCAFAISGKLNLNNIKQAVLIKIPIAAILIHIFSSTIFSSVSLGFLSIMFSGASSTPKAKAGSPSVTKFIHNICTAVKGIITLSPTLNANIIAKNNMSTSPKLLLNK